MKVVVAIDSFKGSMTSVQAGNACKEGILAATCAHCGGGAAAVKGRKIAADNLDVVVKPLADGGEGTVEALVEGMNGTYEYVTVTGPMGNPVKARYGILPDQTAVMEMAEASGITLVEEPLNPWKATSTGVGEMILDAVQKGCRKFIIGIGGSATTEGGIGMLSALGYDFMDENGDRLPPVFDSLEKVVQIKNNRVPEVLKDCHFQIACDVTNPLCGAQGCVYVFGAQKGVKEEEKESMDRAMQSYAACLEKSTGKKLSDIPGTGAAGGLGFAFLWGLPNVELKPGIDIVLEAVGLTNELKDADVVVTGEGCLDFQTAMGKVPVGVAKTAKNYNCKVIAFAGSVTEEAKNCNEKGIDAFFSILPGVCSLDEAMDTEIAQKNMRNAAEQVFRLILACGKEKSFLHP